MNTEHQVQAHMEVPVKHNQICKDTHESLIVFVFDSIGKNSEEGPIRSLGFYR